MKIVLFLTVICFIVGLLPSFSLAAERTEISRHPYLYFSADEIDRIERSGYAAPAFLDEHSFTVTYFGGMKVTYSLPTEQPPNMEPPPGFPGATYPYWTMLTRQLQNRLEALSLAYLSTGDERYSERAIEYALAISAWHTWVEPVYNNSLSVSHLTMGVCTVYDLLYGKMTDEERARIRKAIVNNGINGLLTFSKGWSKAIHNGAGLIHSALGLAALTLIGEENVDAYLDVAKTYTKWWLDNAVSSGQTEGVLYNGYSLSNLTRFLLALKNATGEKELLQHPYFTDHLTSWLTYFSASTFDGIVNFSDSSYDSYGSYVLPLSILNLEQGDPHAGWLLKQWGVDAKTDNTDFSAVVYNVGTVKGSAPPAAWPTSAQFPFGWVALRTGWDKEGSALAFKSSASNQGHNHFDQNHFVLNVNGEWMVTDRGYKDYNAAEYTAGTAGHNALLYDGNGQPRKGGGEIAQFVDGPGISYVVGDASDAYQGELAWQRHILLVKPGGYYLFFDEAEAKSAKAAFFGSGSIEPKVFKFLLHPSDSLVKTIVDGSLARETIDQDASQLLFYGSNASLLWKVIWPAKTRITEVVPENAPGKPSYLAIGSNEKLMKTLMISLLKGEAGVDGVDVPEVVISDEQNHAEFIGFEITRRSGRDLIIWNRSGKPVTWNGMETDGKLACVSLDQNGHVSYASLVAGETLQFNGKTVAQTPLLSQ